MYRIRILINSSLPILVKYKAALLLLILLEISFLLRFYQFSQVAFHDESSRDYLVAHHIIKYHEFPLVGPPDEGRYFLRNNPFYYYFLAFWLLIKDDPFFLGIVNILLQIINIVMIFILSKQLFGTTSALLSSTIFAVGDYFLYQSAYISQSNIMQPFATSSFLLLAIGYKKRKFFLLITSIITLLLAASLHRSALIQVPFLLGLIFMILKSWKVNFRKYLFIIITVVFIGLALYSSVLISTSKLTGDNPPSTYQLSTVPGRNVLVFLWQNISIFLGNIFIGEKIFNVHYTYLLFILIATVFIYFVSKIRSLDLKVRSREKFIYLLVIAGAIVLQFFIPVFVGFNQMRYFTPIFGLFIILISAMISQVAHIDSFGKLIALILATFFLLSTSLDLKDRIYSSLIRTPRMPLEFSVAAVLQDKITEIRSKEGFKYFNFFRIITYRDKYVYNAFNAVFLVPLEKKFNNKLTKNDDNFLNNYAQINYDYYYFIACYEYDSVEDINKHCLNRFLLENGNYRVEGLVDKSAINGKNISIYLAQKNN